MDRDEWNSLEVIKPKDVQGDILAFLRLNNNKAFCIREIRENLGFSNSSVSSALYNLKYKGLVENRMVKYNRMCYWIIKQEVKHD